MRHLLKLLLLQALLFATLTVFSQTPIDVAESTLKIAPSGEEVFYYGFAEGDQLVFNFEEINGKELKELEIVAMPGTSKFMDYKTKKIENKILNITETGIYKFRFANSNVLAGRVCKFKIQRIPESEKTKKFNTAVYKRTVYDTTYYNAPERYLVKSDTVISEMVNQTAKVHSNGNINGNKTTFNFILPNNTIAWSYYIGVDQAGQQAYQTASKQLMSSSSPVVSKLFISSPLTALAFGAVSYLTQLQRGEDIDYFIVEGQNKNLFLSGQQFSYIKNGKVINDFAKMPPFKGNLFFCFSNDNAVIPVSVFVKIEAIQVNEIWDIKEVKKMNVISRQEMYLKDIK